MQRTPPPLRAWREGATRSRLAGWPLWKRAGAGLLLAAHGLWAPVASGQAPSLRGGPEVRTQERAPEYGAEYEEEEQKPSAAGEEEGPQEEEASASEEDMESKPRPGAFPRLLSVQVGTELWGRRLRFSGAQGGFLLNHLAPVVLSPRVRVELYPLGLWTEGLASRFSLEADFAMAVGSKTRWVEGPLFPLEAQRFDVGVRLGFVRGARLVVSPTLGLRRTRLGLGAAEDGTQLEGLPGVSYESIRGGLALRVMQRRALSLLAEVNYLHILSSGSISREPFFPGMRAYGVEGRVGLEYHSTRVVAVRLEGFFTRYALQLELEPERAPLSEGGADQHAGASLGLRFSW